MLVMFAAPFVVGMCIGHFWGFLVTLISIAIYVWFGARQTMAFSTRVIWVIGIGFLLITAAFEFAQISH